MSKTPPNPTVPLKNPPAQANQSLQAGIDSLLAIISSDKPIGCKEVAEMLGTNATRANRLLGTLASMGLAQRTPQRKYEPGPGLHVLAAMSLHGSRLLKSAAPTIRDLHEATGHAVALGTLWQGQVCYLYHGAPSRRWEDALDGATLHPASISSIGRILIASEDVKEAEALIRRQPIGEEYSSHEELLADLPIFQKQGFATTALGSGSVAVSIGKDRPVAGLALAGAECIPPSDDLINTMKIAAEAIYKRMTN